MMSDPSSRACKPVTAKLTPFSIVSGMKSGEKQQKYMGNQ
jgi:hypothetical protein